MNIFIPTPKDLLITTADFSYLEGIVSTVYPVGTVFRIERIKVNKLTKRSDKYNLYLQLLHVPGRPDLSMKKYGGDMAYGHMLYFSLDQFAALEVDHFQP